MDNAGYPTTPTDLGTLGRRLVRLERLVELGAGARTLAKAAVGRGGIRVTKAGSITVEGGGSVVIETGNLVLGAGKIDGAALKHQLEAAGLSATGTNFPVGTGWWAHARVTVTPPAWATETVVQGFGMSRVKVVGGKPGEDIDADMRVVIAGDAGLESTLTVFGHGNNTWSSGCVTHAKTTTSKSFTVELQMRARTNGVYTKNTANIADLRATALFMR